MRADPETYNGATVATEEMLTAEKLSWTLGASVGIKFSKQFAMNKQAQKVPYRPDQETAEPNSGNQGGNTGGNSGDNGELG